MAGNTQIVARMARARPAPDAGRASVPKAGSTEGPRTDTNTYSAIYAQATADRSEEKKGGGSFPGHSQPPPPAKLNPQPITLNP